MGPSATTPCPCGCASREGDAHHRIAEALARDDIDAALTLGLLTAAACPACGADCRARVERIGDQRRGALAARERYRARAVRLARRAAERDARRAGPATTAGPGTATPALSGAAAAALARAKARAAGRRTP